MPVILRSNWWALLLRGILAILLAIITFAVPSITIAILVTIFGIYALLDGALAIVSAFRAARGHRPWGSFVLEGIVGLLVGIYAIAAPVSAAAIFVTVMAIWAFVTGIFEIMAAVRLRRHIQGEWVLIGMGVLSILFSIVLFAAPLAGAVALVWVLAAYALFFGVLLVVLAFRVRNMPALASPAAPVV